MMEMPIIDLSKCNGCGVCVEVCLCQKLVPADKGVEILENVECHSCASWCTMCEMVCPTGAIQCPFEVVIED